MNLNWRIAAELIALGSVVATLFFVGYELRQNRQVAVTESFYSSAENEANLRGMIAEHPVAWRKGCLGEPLTEQEEITFSQLARALNTHYFMTWRRSIDGIRTVDSERWTKTVALNMVHYPGFRDAWRAMESTAPSTIVLEQSTNAWVIDIESYYEEYSQDPKMNTPIGFACGM